MGSKKDWFLKVEKKGKKDGKKKNVERQRGGQNLCNHSLMTLSCFFSPALTFLLISSTWGGSILLFLSLSSLPNPLWVSWRFLFFYFFSECFERVNWRWKRETWFPFISFRELICHFPSAQNGNCHSRKHECRFPGNRLPSPGSNSNLFPRTYFSFF